MKFYITSREEYKLLGIPDRLLKTISSSEREKIAGDLRKPRSEELHASHSSANINFDDHIIKEGELEDLIYLTFRSSNRD
jgi:hypothetical protein